MKYIVIAILSYLSLSNDIHSSKLADINRIIPEDSSNVIKNKGGEILDCLRRKQCESKVNCYEKNDLNQHRDKLLLFAPLDSFYISKKEYKISELKKFRYPFRKYLNYNNQLKNSLAYRLQRYYGNPEWFYPCYELSEFKFINSDKSMNDTCLQYIDSALRDYIVVEVKRIPGLLVKDNENMNNLKDDYRCYYGAGLDGLVLPVEFSYFMLYSIKINKPHLILGNDFCQADADWKTLYKELVTIYITDLNIFRYDI